MLLRAEACHPPKASRNEEKIFLFRLFCRVPRLYPIALCSRCRRGIILASNVKSEMERGFEMMTTEERLDCLECELERAIIALRWFLRLRFQNLRRVTTFFESGIFDTAPGSNPTSDLFLSEPKKHIIITIATRPKTIERA